MNWTSPEIIIGLYGAVLSTFIFVWRLFEKYIDSKGKLKVQVSIKTQIPVFQDYSLGEERLVLEFKITNEGKQTRYIDRPSLEFNRLTSKGKVITPLIKEDKNQYPVAINHGEIIELYGDLNSLRLGVIKGTDFKRAKKIRGYTKDTLGKLYYSKWMKLEEFVGWKKV